MKDIYLTNVKSLILFLCSSYHQLVDEVNTVSGSEELFCMPKEVFIQSLSTSKYTIGKSLGYLKTIMQGLQTENLLF